MVGRGGHGNKGQYVLTYDSQPFYTVSIMKVHGVKVAHETQYFADPSRPWNGATNGWKIWTAPRIEEVPKGRSQDWAADREYFETRLVETNISHWRSIERSQFEGALPSARGSGLMTTQRRLTVGSDAASNAVAVAVRV
jgi:hypothetical protein